MAERGARDAVDEDRRVARREHKVVDAGDGADDALAEHEREPPAATRLAHRVPLCELHAVGQAREHRPPACALGDDDAHDVPGSNISLRLDTALSPVFGFLEFLSFWVFW